jgi:hypothetical protein
VFFIGLIRNHKIPLRYRTFDNLRDLSVA